MGWTDRDKPYIFGILRIPGMSSQNKFQKKSIKGEIIQKKCVQSKKRHVDGQTRQRRVFPLVIIIIIIIIITIIIVGIAWTHTAFNFI